MTPASQRPAGAGAGGLRPRPGPQLGQPLLPGVRQSLPLTTNSAQDPAQLTRPTSTIWIWLALAVQTLVVASFFLAPWGTYIDAMVLLFTSTGSEADPAAVSKLTQFTTVGAAIAVVAGVLAIIGYIFIYRDWRELMHRGVMSPFHWAFALLSPTIYGIGRGVVLRRRGRPARAPFWAQIAPLILTVIAVVVFFVYIGTTLYHRLNSASVY